MMPSDVSRLKHRDPSTIEVLRRALDDVLTDRRFSHQRSASALEIAEHLLAQAASGERDLERLKSSAFAKLSAATERQEGLPGSAARRG
jgi:hypothetical protein